MNARLISKMVVVGIVFFGLILVGLKAGKWAEETSKACEKGYSDAIAVLQQ